MDLSALEGRFGRHGVRLYNASRSFTARLWKALAGDHGAAAAIMASLAQSKQFVSGYDRAAVYVALGRTDDAFAALEEAYQSRAEWVAYLKVDPQMDTLRRDPRYTTLLKRLGL